MNDRGEQSGGGRNRQAHKISLVQFRRIARHGESGRSGHYVESGQSERAANQKEKRNPPCQLPQSVRRTIPPGVGHHRRGHPEGYDDSDTVQLPPDYSVTFGLPTAPSL